MKLAMSVSNASIMLPSFSFALTELYHLKTALTVCGAKWVLFGAEWEFWQSNQEIFT
jgi:hypothetical protein